MFEDVPVFAICGHSGSGKTTLIEKVLPHLRRRGLSVAVIKHDVHGVQLDPAGKDSQRLMAAGADVCLQGPNESFVRSRCGGQEELALQVERLAGWHELILLEGFRRVPVPKVWLLSDGEAAPPAEVPHIQQVLPRSADRPGILMSLLDQRLAEHVARTPVFGCVLMGGHSTRMGRPKHLIRSGGCTWLERIRGMLAPLTQRVVLIGGNEVPEAVANDPRLADVPDAQGPMAGVLAAMRWAPRATWLLAACDMPLVDEAALEWLLAARRPDRWAVLPVVDPDRGVEPLLACYEWRARNLLESMARQSSWSPRRLAEHPKIASPQVPAELQKAWCNINTPAELESHGLADTPALPAGPGAYPPGGCP